MFWADRIGLEHVRDAMRRYGEAGGADYWAPSPLIERLAASGRGFYSVSSMTDGPSFG
jgi:3-hydroxyacyl-CoA dehydrogenase